MDNLTHTLFGAALAEAGLRRKSPLAMPVLLIGANLPDIDIAAALLGQSLSFRRGWTHGALAIVVLPLLLTAGMLAWERWRRSRREVSAPSQAARRSKDASSPPGSREIPTPAGEFNSLLLVSFIGVISHPFLDWLNNYGLRWLMPFDGTWYYGDALFIIDPWVWLTLLLGIFIARRLRSVAVGATTVTLCLAYFGFMLATAASGRRFVREAARDRGITPDAVMVGPVPIAPLRRQVIIQTGDAYRTGSLSWNGRPILRLDERPIPRGDDHPAIDAALRTPELRHFLAWSRFPFFVVAANEGDWTVTADDLRYAARRVGSFATTTVTVPRESDGASSAQP